MTRKNCQRPGACVAGRRGRCSVCHELTHAQKARMSEASRKAWADPEVRARTSEASRKALADPEVRARMSEASRKAWAKKKTGDVEIPRWVVMADLVGEFVDIAAIGGEEAAASHCRRLKREMAA